MSSIVDVSELGRRIRKLRIERRMTLKEVERSCGLSATHLSEIERGRTSPTIGALVRIARALEKDPSYFIESEEREEAAQVLREQARPVRGHAEVALALTPGIPGSRISAYRLALDPGPRAIEWASAAHEGEAVLYVRSGAIDATIGGEDVRLESGDTLQVSLDQPCRLRASDASAEAYLLTTSSLEAAS